MNIYAQTSSTQSTMDEYRDSHVLETERDVDSFIVWALVNYGDDLKAVYMGNDCYLV